MEGVEENIIDVEVTCPYCNTTFKPKVNDIRFDTLGRLRVKCQNHACTKLFIVPKEVAEELKEKAHSMGIELKQEDKDKSKDSGEGGSPEVEDMDVELIEYQGKKTTPEDLIFTKGIEGVYYLMELELEKALREIPAKISEKMAKFVLDRFRESDFYKRNEQALTLLLANVLKISPVLVNDIVRRVFSIPKKYEHILKLALQSDPYMMQAYLYPPSETPMPTPQYPMMPTTNRDWVSELMSKMGAPTPPMQNPMPAQTPNQMMYPQMYPPNPYAPAQLQYQEPHKEDKNNGFVTKQELIELLDEYFERKRKEEEEKKMFEVLMEKIAKLEEELKKKDEEDEEPKPAVSQEDVILSYIDSLRAEIESIKQALSGKNTETNPFKELTSMIRELKELEKLLGGEKKEIPDEVKSTIEELRRQIQEMTGRLDPEVLKLKELNIQKEMKQIELKEMREMVERIAKTIENLPQKAGIALGQILAGMPAQPMARNIVPTGNGALVLCPFCGYEFRTTNTDEIVCPKCNKVIYKREGEKEGQ